MVDATDTVAVIVLVTLSHLLKFSYTFLSSVLYTPWAIKKRAPFIFSIALANIDGFS